MKKIPFLYTFKKLFSFLTPPEKRKTFFFFFLMLANAGFELVGLSLILPFIQLINNPGVIENSAKLSKVYHFLGFSMAPESIRRFQVILGLSLIAVYVLKNLLFIGMTDLQTRFTCKKKLSLAEELLEAYLKSPYSFFLKQNSNDLSRNVSSTAKVMDNVWSPLMIMTTELIMVSSILLFLFFANPAITLAALIVIGGINVGFYRIVRNKISEWTKKLFYHNGQIGKWVHQSFGGIKEIKVLGKELYFIDAYKKHAGEIHHYTRKNQLLGQMPRPVLETVLVVSVLSMLVYLIYTGQDLSKMLPTLALFAVAAFRIMPSANRLVASSFAVRDGLTTVDLIYTNFKNMDGSRLSLDLSLKEEVNTPVLPFKNEISFDQVTFYYESSKAPAIDALSFSVKKGEAVALVGHSGAGKTTAADLLLGLLTPTKGEIRIDGHALNPDNLRAWQKNIGYIPQFIFLSDDTIRRNIAFGVRDEQIDEQKVWHALKLAQLDEFIRGLPEGLDTMVGERGVRLSGGQRQRIGIARALYFDPEVLILDEATSALDNETEQAITSSIDSLHGTKTLFIIAHRLSTVAHCDRLYFFKEGHLIASGPLNTLLEKNQEFVKMAGSNLINNP